MSDKDDMAGMFADAMKMVQELNENDRDIINSLVTMHGKHAGEVYRAALEQTECFNVFIVTCAGTLPDFAMKLLVEKAIKSSTMTTIVMLELIPPKRRSEVMQIIQNEIKRRTSMFMGLMEKHTKR